MNTLNEHIKKAFPPVTLSVVLTHFYTNDWSNENRMSNHQRNEREEENFTRMHNKSNVKKRYNEPCSCPCHTHLSQNKD